MFEPRNRPSDLRIDECEYREEIYIGIQIVEDEEIVDGVPGEGGRKRDAFGPRKLRTPPECEERGTEEREIEQECRQASGGEPIDKSVVRAVEPRLLLVERRIVVCIENIVETLLPPAGQGALEHPLKRHATDREARLTVRERDGGDASEHMTLLHEGRVACEIQTARDDENKNEGSSS